MTIRTFWAVAAMSVVISSAADWPSEAGDPQRTGWQKREQVLTPRSVKGIKLLWRLRLGQGDSREALATPTILGHIITHRGIKALVFVTGSDDTVYAVDADLGTVFWERHWNEPRPLPQQSRAGCDNHLPPAPVLTPAPEPAASSDGDDDDDPAQGNRPLYVLSAGGEVHEIHPSTGDDISAPRVFSSPAGGLLSLNLFGGALYATGPAGCAEPSGKIWSIDLKNPGSAPVSRDSNPGPGVTVGTDGTVYSTNSNAVTALAAGSLKPKDYYNAPEQASATPMIVRWRNRELLVVPTAGGRILLLNAKNLGGKTHREAVFRSEPFLDGGSQAISQFKGMAASKDSSGTTWIHAASQSGIMAFRIEAKAGRPVLTRSWNSPGLAMPSAPVVAGGVVYALANGPRGTTILHALDAVHGDELYSSAVPSKAHSARVAVANGHVCFGAAENTLYCFGIPIEL